MKIKKYNNVVRFQLNLTKYFSSIAFTFIILFLSFSNIAFGQTSPYPPSPFISGITFNFSTLDKRAPGSDNWAITWADDGHQYVSWGDGGGFGGSNSDGRVSLGFARIEGTKDNYQGFNVWGGKNSENPAQFKKGKSYGIICIDGIIYMWRANQDQGTGNAYGTQTLYKSIDHAASFTNTGVSWDEGFFCPTILNFGKDYAGARDDYVYMYAPEQKRDEWNVSIPGEIIMMRVRKSDIENKSSYEFFAGIDNNSNPAWTSNVDKRKPVFEDTNNGVMRTSVSYNPGLGRYFLITQQIDRYKGGHIGIYDAPEPWGPWTTVLFDNAWDVGLQDGVKTVFWNFSNKWLSSDGKDFVLVYTGTGKDEWGTIEGSFSLSDTKPPSESPLPPVNLRIVN